jgi:hypothetical protein
MTGPHLPSQNPGKRPRLGFGLFEKPAASGKQPPPGVPEKGFPAGLCGRDILNLISLWFTLFQNGFPEKNQGRSKDT